MKKTTKKTALLTAVGVLVCSALGLGAGSALGQTGTLLAPTGVRPAEGVAYEPQPEPTYPVNDSGLTYGSASDAISPETEPDLILVVTEDGTEGYVKKVDLDDANGTTAAAGFRSPDDALAWQQERIAQGDLRIPVYQVDGVTVVGEFVVYAPGTGEATTGLED